MVPSNATQLLRFPRLAGHWATEVVLIAAPELNLAGDRARRLQADGVAIHWGSVTALEHCEGELTAVVLDDGKSISVGTLLWQPPKAPAPLLERLVEDLGVEIGPSGEVVTDDNHQTRAPGLYAVGDGWWILRR